MIFKLILTEMGFIPAIGTKIDTKQLHLARNEHTICTSFDEQFKH